MAQGEVIFSAPIVGSKTEDRVIVELDKKDGGGWVVGRVQRSDRTKFTRECSFTLAELIQVASWGMTGDPAISKAFADRPGLGLSAGIILGAMAFGFIKTERKT